MIRVLKVSVSDVRGLIKGAMLEEIACKAMQEEEDGAKEDLWAMIGMVCTVLKRSHKTQGIKGWQRKEIC